MANGGSGGAADRQPLHQGLKSRPLHPEARGGAPGAAEHPVHFLEHARDVRPLDSLERRRAPALRRRGRPAGEVRERYRAPWAGRENPRPLARVAASPLAAASEPMPPTDSRVGRGREGEGHLRRPEPHRSAERSAPVPTDRRAFLQIPPPGGPCGTARELREAQTMQNGMSQFAGKVALVTGGNAGIGRAAAIAFAKQGAQVVVSGRRETEGNAVIAEIEASGGEAIFVKTDVAKEGDVKAMIGRALARFGRLDCAFNNAGIEQALTPLPDQTEETYDQIMDVNVKGVWLSLKHEIPAMLKTGGGAIVNNSSIAGLIGFATAPLYAASKHAVAGLTKSVALEYAKQNVRVNAVAPGAIATRMFRDFATTPEMRQMLESAHPIGRIGRPEEIASTVIWLCSDGASFVTGQIVPVDGGYTSQ